MLVQRSFFESNVHIPLLKNGPCIGQGFVHSCSSFGLLGTHPEFITGLGAVLVTIEILNKKLSDVLTD